jgi:hypothetical protein
VKAIFFYFCMIAAAAAQTYPYHGCYLDQQAKRSLPTLLIPSGATVESCAAAAGTQYPFFGLQYGGQCYGGTSPGTLEAASNCSMPCSANTTELCGGAWANSVYSAQTCPAGTYMTSSLPFTCVPVLGMCSSSPTLGSACSKGDSCFLTNRTVSPPKISSYFCDGTWAATAPVQAIVR